jgi:hypothetical protein
MTFLCKQKSQALFHPALLKTLYIKGHWKLVVRVLLKLKALLKEDAEKHICDYLDMDLEALLVELKA